MRNFDYSAVLNFLRDFFAGTDDDVELRAIRVARVGGGAARPPLVTRISSEIIEFCIACDRDGVAIYFGIATRRRGARSGKREDISELPGLWLDIDCLKIGVTIEEAVAALRASPMSPSVIIMSGHGVHAYWLLREKLDVLAPPVGEVDEIKERIDSALRQLAGMFAGDLPVCQIAAIMRLPGTHNTKEEGEMILTGVVEANWETRYELDDIEEMLANARPLLVAPTAAKPVQAGQVSEQVNPRLGGGAGSDPFLEFGAQAPMDIEFELEAMALHSADKPIHHTRVRAAASLVARGHSDEAIFDRLLEATAKKIGEAGEQWTPRRERDESRKLRDEIRSAHAKGYDPKTAPEPALPPGVVPFLRPLSQEQPEERPEERPDDDPLPAPAPKKKPTLPIRAGHLAETADMAERMLVELGAPFYRRSARMMRPIIEDDWAADEIKTKVARLVEVSPPFMLDYMSRLANWTKYDKRSKAWVPCDPPKELAITILAREGEWQALPVAGVITTPTMRPDGSLLLTEGYDPETRLILLSPPPMPIITPQPSREEALAALALLDALLDEFCFVDAPSRAVAMSALITPVVRGAFPVVPAHVMRAPVAGSGKSYLIDISAAISTGQRCPVISPGKTEEEQEKRLGAVLMGGQPLISIDNLNGELGGDALCQILTQPIVQIRILGRSEMMRVETRATIFATGNNIIIVGDMVRRTLLGSMDTNVERPELREFRHKPLEMVLQDRGKYIAACLTIVRAYQQAGYPDALKPLPSFEKWSLMVRSALVWLGMADPVETMETARNNDPKRIQLSNVIESWQATIGLNIDKSPGQVVAIAEEKHTPDPPGPEILKNPELHEALSAVAASAGRLDPQKLGYWLLGHEHNPSGGLWLERSTSTHRKVNLWRVCRLPDGEGKT